MQACRSAAEPQVLGTIPELIFVCLSSQATIQQRFLVPSSAHGRAFTQTPRCMAGCSKLHTRRNRGIPEIGHVLRWCEMMRSRKISTRASHVLERNSGLAAGAREGLPGILLQVRLREELRRVVDLMQQEAVWDKNKRDRGFAVCGWRRVTSHGRDIP